MPSGIILSSGSQGATQEAIEKVLVDNGYEADKPAATEAEAEPVEPKREDFKSDEEFETAQEDFETKLEEQEAAELQKDEEEERKRLDALPKKSRRQRAIEKATKDLAEQNRKLAERLAALESGKKPAVAAAAESDVKLEAPKREDFKTDEEFEEAKFDYRYQMRRLKEATDAARNQQANQLKENYEQYKTNVVEFKNSHDDWDEVVNQKIPILESVYLTIHELENGPAVTYYLGKHPAYAQKLAEMSPLAAVVEVGRLADRLKTGAPNRGEADGAAKQRKPRQKLPEPVRPVSTSATSSSLTSREAASKRDFRSFKAAQRAGR